MDGLFTSNLKSAFKKVIDGEKEIHYKEEMQKKKESLRKKKMEDIITSKRHNLEQINQNTIQEYFEPEEKEDIYMQDKKDIQELEEHWKEEIGGKDYARVDQHFIKKAKRSKKKCWICRSFNHLKSRCPNIKCFYCGKRGHVKANCYRKKIDYLFARLKETIGEKETKKDKKMKKKIRKRQRKKEMKIIDFRAKYLSSEMKKTEKGDEFFIKWKQIGIGKFIGQGLPEQMIKPFQEHQFDKKLIFRLLKKDTPLSCFALYDGCTNWCSCGEIDLDRNTFIHHVKRCHKSIIPKNSQVNRPFWYDMVEFTSDEIEHKFCYSLSKLDDKT